MRSTKYTLVDFDNKMSLYIDKIDSEKLSKNWCEVSVGGKRREKVGDARLMFLQNDSAFH